MKRFLQTLLAVACAVTLGQIPITGLPPATLPLSGTEQIPMVQNNKTVQAPANKVGVTTAAGVISLWAPTCNNTTFLRGDGVCATASSPPGGANNTVQYNNGGVFGGDSNFTWVPNSGATFTGFTNTNYPLNVVASSTTGDSYGIKVSGVQSGATDHAVTILGASGADLFHVNGNGSGAINGAGADGEATWDLNGWKFTHGLSQQIKIDNDNNVGLQVLNDQNGGAGVAVDIEQLQLTDTGNLLQVFDYNAAPLFQLAPSGVASPTVQITGRTANQPGLSVDQSNVTNTLPTATVNIQGSSTTGKSNGLLMRAGTNNQDITFRASSTGGSGIYENIQGDGSGCLGPGNCLSNTSGLFWSAGGNYVLPAPTVTSPTLEVDGIAGSTTLFVKNAAGGASGNTGIFISGQAPGAAGQQLLVVNASGGLTQTSLDGDGKGCIGHNCNSGTGGNGLGWSTTGNFTMGSATGASAELTINGNNGQYGEVINGNNTTGGSDGLQITAGTNGSDTAIFIQNQSGGNQFFEIFGAGNGFLGPNATNDLSWNTSGAFTVAAPTAGTALTVNGLANQFGMVVNSASSGTENGLGVNAGAIGTDLTFDFKNKAGTVQVLRGFGDGGVVQNSATGGNKGVGTINNTGGYYVNGTALPPAPITCTTACSGAALLVGQQLIINKTSSTSRASTTTQTIDADLNVTAMPNSSYATVFISLYFGAGANAGGYRAVLNNGGACNTGFPGSGYWSFNNNTPAVSRGDAANAISFTSSSASEWVQFTGTLQGNSGISVCWAQNTSNVTNTTLTGNGLIGTFIVVTRVL